MNETVSEPEKNLVPIGSRRGGTRRMFLAAFALGRPCSSAFFLPDIRLIEPFRQISTDRLWYPPRRRSTSISWTRREGISAEPDARESCVVFLRIYPLPKRLPDNVERSGKGLSGAAALRIAQKSKSSSSA